MGSIKQIFQKVQAKKAGVGKDGSTHKLFRGSTEVTGMPAGTAVPLHPRAAPPPSPTSGPVTTPLGGSTPRRRGGAR